MTKAETIGQILKLTGAHPENVNTIVLELLASIINALEAREPVFIYRFDTFAIVSTAIRR